MYFRPLKNFINILYIQKFSSHCSLLENSTEPLLHLLFNNGRPQVPGNIRCGRKVSNSWEKNLTCLPVNDVMKEAAQTLKLSEVSAGKSIPQK
jgi:hypothetical protein